MNQAFETTYVEAGGMEPSKPVVLDLDEEMMTNLLIIRKAEPLDVDGALAEEQAKKKLSDILGVDFLDSSEMLSDELDDEDERWRTDLDDNAFFFGDLLGDILEQLNLALSKQLRSEFNKNKDTKKGLDEQTGTRLREEDGNWILSRKDLDAGLYWELKLNQDDGYVINFKQQDFEWFDYRLGDGDNRITIIQKR
jgi:hypothetical protein